MFEPTWTWPNLTFGQLFMWIGANNWPKLCMCIGVNRWIFWKSPNVVLTKIQNFIEIQSSRFRWYCFVFARTQSRLVYIHVFHVHSLRIYIELRWPRDTFVFVGSKVCCSILQDKSLQLVIRVLTSFKLSEIEGGIKTLDQQKIDVLMKYIYRGFETPSEGSSAQLLAWHEKVIN